MRKFIEALVLFVFIAAPAIAQRAPKLEVFGGYQYFNFGFSGNVLDMNGFNGSVTYNFHRLFGLTADFAGVYNNSGVNGTTHIYTYLFGPTIYPLGHHRLTMFIHGLAGEGHMNVNIPASGGLPAVNDSDNGFTYAAGGGFDWKFMPHIAFRLFQGDYEQTKFFTYLSGVPVQKNYRISAGVVIRL